MQLETLIYFRNSRMSRLLNNSVTKPNQTKVDCCNILSKQLSQQYHEGWLILRMSKLIDQLHHTLSVIFLVSIHTMGKGTAASPSR